MALNALIRIFTIMSACAFGTSPAVSLSVPSRVLALEGSRLLIPCSFSPVPAAQTIEIRLVRSASSFFMNLRRPIFSSEGDAVHPDFRERTALAGNISAGDCSISISSVRSQDQNTYELQVRERGQRSWPAGRKVNVSVTAPPRDVQVQVLSASLRLGGNALLLCSCKADPPASDFQWWSVESGNTLLLPKRTHIIRIFNISRDTRVQCSAANPVGRASSRQTKLNVQYAPVILSSSSCVFVGSLLSCWCLVDSNPRPVVTWSVNGTHLLDKFNASFSYVNHTLTATLSGITDAPLPVECHAVSALGNHSHLLYEPHSGDLIWTVILTAGAVFVLLLLFLLLFLCWCCRTNRRPPAVRPELLGVYQERTPLYINCSEVTNVYSNGSYQPIYQNCTPLFVRSKQTYKRQRRGARRQRAQIETLNPVSADSETAIYVEVI